MQLARLSSVEELMGVGMAREYRNEDPIHQGQQAWVILVSAAHNRQTITYRQLATAMFDGYDEPQPLLTHRPLIAVAAFCRREELPNLTAIMASEDERFLGLPAEGIHRDYVALDAANAEREKAYRYNWYGVMVPTISELAAA